MHEDPQPTPAPQAAPALPEGAFNGRPAFQDAIRAALAAAASEGWREIVLSDASFEDWPLGERAVAEALNAWSASGRHCILLARRWDDVVRRHARFVSWRRTWAHIIDARACSSADPLELPSAIWTPAWILQRNDPERSRGTASREPSRRLALREALNEWLARSTPGFPAHTLGL